MFEALAGPSGLVTPRPGPDLAAHGWTETEYVVRGTAPSYAGNLPADGRWALTVSGEGGFVTRCVVRRPSSAATFSGTARAGVRTPALDAPTAVLRGDTDPDAPAICRLFGSTLPLDAEVLRWLYPDRDTYLAASAMATDAAIDSGFVLPEDREAVLAEARPDLVEAAHQGS